MLRLDIVEIDVEQVRICRSFAAARPVSWRLGGEISNPTLKVGHSLRCEKDLNDDG